MVNFASPVEILYHLVFSILINIILFNCNYVAWHRIDDTIFWTYLV
jgi:hypothetical protein